MSIYEIIVDPRYTNKMMVVVFNPYTDRVQRNITFKDIYITEVNGYTINQPTELINGSLAGNDYDIDKQKKEATWKRKETSR